MEAAATAREGPDMARARADAEPADVRRPPVGRHEPQEGNEVVEAFRHSQGSRDPRKLSNFMETMAAAIARHPETSERHLRQLLGVWRWNFGETFDWEHGKGVNVGALMTSSIVRPVVKALGGSRIAEAHLRLLLETVCREPDNIPPGEESTDRLTDHAEWAASALRQMVLHSAVDRREVSLEKRQASEEEQLRRLLRMLFEAPSHDPRWMPLIAVLLPELGPVRAWGMHMTQARWTSAVFEEFSTFMSKAYPGSKIPYYEYHTLKTLLLKASRLQEPSPQTKLAAEFLSHPHRQGAAPTSTQVAAAKSRDRAESTRRYAPAAAPR